MNSFAVLVGKEVRALFLSPIAWALIAVFLFLMGYSFTLTLFSTSAATLVHVFFQAAGLLLLLVPIITMRSFAEERKAGTLELLLTAPVREGRLVLAKFVASLAVVLVMIMATGIYAGVLGWFGAPDWGAIYSGYFGLVLLAAALVAIGVMFSAMTSNQVVGAILAIGVSFLLWTLDSLAQLLPTGPERVLIGLSLLARFTPFATGAMYASDLGFFVTVTALALFVGVRALARR
ncbi:MAG: ABC transporter permease subunit [Limnobacter sp.]|nr:ABC transporter permease subunit [Limnobacter sp.]